MPSMAYSIGVLLALACATVTQGCGECGGTTQRPVTLLGDEWMAHRAPGDLLHSLAGGCQGHDHLVQEMLQHMEKFVHFEQPPNPSILLAMNLAGDTHGHIHKCLLQAIKNHAVKRAQKDMPSGQVALYVLALLSSCLDPRCIHAMGETINLIPILKEKMNEEIRKNGITWYNKSLDILTLCLVKEYDYRDAAVAVAKELRKPNNSLCVDTQAMVVLALVCAYNHTDNDTQHLIHEALHKVTNHFLDEQEKNNGMIGSISSMGLALQALETSSEFYAPRKWNSTQACNVVYNHDYKQPMAIAQVLPPLVGKSYLNAAPITVQFSITNTLKNYFDYSTSVCVPDNSTLFQVMKVAADEKPDIFCFETVLTKLGPFVTSIHGLAGNTTNRTYWQFFSSWSPLQKGVGTYKPKNWELIQAIFSTY